MDSPHVHTSPRATLHNFVFTALDRSQGSNIPTRQVHSAIEICGRALDLFDLQTSLAVRMRVWYPRLQRELDALQPGPEGIFTVGLSWWLQLSSVLAVCARSQLIRTTTNNMPMETFDDCKAFVQTVLQIACATDMRRPNFTTLEEFAAVFFDDGMDREGAIGQAVQDLADITSVLMYGSELITALAGFRNIVEEEERLFRLSERYNLLLLGNPHDDAADAFADWTPHLTSLSAAEVAEAGEEGCVICKFSEDKDELVRLSCSCPVAFHKDCLQSYLDTEDDDGHKPRPICPHCRQPIRHELVEQPLPRARDVAAEIDLMRSHPRDNVPWRPYQHGPSVRMMRNRVEYDVNGWRQPRAHEPEFAEDEAGTRIDLAYNVWGEAAGRRGMERVAGRSVVHSDTSQFLVCGECEACREALPEAYLNISMREERGVLLFPDEEDVMRIML